MEAEEEVRMETEEVPEFPEVPDVPEVLDSPEEEEEVDIFFSFLLFLPSYLSIRVTF